MRKIIILAAVLLLGALPSVAQYEVPPMEIFGGISFFDLSGAPGLARGGQGEFVINISQKMALLIEVGIQKDTIDLGPAGTVKVTLGTIQTGFRFYLVRNDRFSVFGHLMTGGLFLSSGLGDSNAGAFTPGGGVEINLTRKFAIRPIQVDLILAQTFTGTKSNKRYGSGIVYRFGD